MKKIIQHISTVLMMIAFCSSAVARDLPRIANAPLDKQVEHRRGIIETHNALESESLRISMDSKQYGFIEGKVCDQCEVIKVNITPQTKAYKGNVEVPLTSAKSRLGRFATVVFELKTNNVSAIRW